MKLAKHESLSKTMQKYSLAILLLLSSLAVAGENVRLYDLDPNDGVRESGMRLMDLPHGLHALEETTNQIDTLVIGIHGFGSRGYEWVYPLQTMDDESSSTFFLRWNFNECPEASTELLLENLKAILDQHSNISRIIIAGHSYGGVFVSSLVDDWPFKINTDFHVIASPLAGIQRLTEQCKPFLPNRLFAHTRFFQWRTRHELDGAFKDLETDPQIVDVEGSLVVTLPETYRERRLGHNWAISWVAEKIAAERK